VRSYSPVMFFCLACHLGKAPESLRNECVAQGPWGGHNPARLSGNDVHLFFFVGFQFGRDTIHTSIIISEVAAHAHTSKLHVTRAHTPRERAEAQNLRPNYITAALL
jgi:hypothetical protein